VLLCCGAAVRPRHLVVLAAIMFPQAPVHDDAVDNVLPTSNVYT